MGGNEGARRRRSAPRGRTSTLRGISSFSSSPSISSSKVLSSIPRCFEGGEGGGIYAGSRVEAAVDGFRSCRGEGSRLMWAVWITSATCVGIEDIMGLRTCVYNEWIYRAIARTAFSSFDVFGSIVEFW